MKKEKKKVGRPLLGREAKVVCTFRIETRIKNIIIGKFGSIQAWIEGLIDEVKKSDGKKKVGD